VLHAAQAVAQAQYPGKDAGSSLGVGEMAARSWQLLGWISRWTTKLAFSVADQGLSSGGHFVVNLLLVRWLPPSDYGAFAVSYSLFLILAGIHNALILEPMSIVGPGNYERELTGYVKSSARINAALALALGAVLGLLCVVAHLLGSPLASGLGGLAAAAPLLLTFWFFRRACYLRMMPRLAFESSLVYSAVLLGGLCIAWRLGWISPAAAFSWMGLGGAAASWMLRARVTQGRGVSSAGSRFPSCWAVIGEHRSYAGWFLATTASYWLASSVYLPLIGALAGLRAAGAYRAMESLLLPMNQTLTACGLLLLPALSREGSTRGRTCLSRAATRISFGAALAVAAYVLMIILLGKNLVLTLYGRAYYAEFLPLIPYLGGALVLRAVSDTGFGTAAKAARRPEIGFWSTLSASAVTLTAGLVLVRTHGASGAAAAWLLSAGVHAMVTVAMFRKAAR